MRTSVTWFLILSVLIGLLASSLACTSTELIPKIAPGEIVGIHTGTWSLSLEKNADDEVTAEIDTILPTNLHVEVICKSADGPKVYAGVVADGEMFELPPGAKIMTASNTSDPVTGGLSEVDMSGGFAPGKSPTPGVGTPFGQVTQTYVVSTMPVDIVDPDNWDTIGSFTVSAGSVPQAHATIRSWVRAHGQGALVNSLIDEVHEAYTTQFVQDQTGNAVFRVTSLNDQQSAVSGVFAYEDGAQAPLTWPTMAPVNDLWQTSLDLDLGMFPAGSEGLLESFAVRIQSWNQVDGLTDASFGVEHGGVQVP
jgi:hypothetical protein